jgi:ferritin-like metal-binding protein YciE
MKLESLQELYLNELRDLFDVEDRIINALPKMIEKAESDELRTALENHLEQTREHATRLEQVFQFHGETPKGVKCKGIIGILDEGESLVKDADPFVRDAAIIAAAQRVEHYEMAGYGTVRTYAEELGHSDAARLLQKTLDEERAADQKLSQIAMQRANQEAMRTA